MGTRYKTTNPNRRHLRTFERTSRFEELQDHPTDQSEEGSTGLSNNQKEWEGRSTSKVRCKRMGKNRRGSDRRVADGAPDANRCIHTSTYVEMRSPPAGGHCSSIMSIPASPKTCRTYLTPSLHSTDPRGGQGRQRRFPFWCGRLAIASLILLPRYSISCIMSRWEQIPEIY